jgi:hypothetical protein
MTMDPWTEAEASATRLEARDPKTDDIPELDIPEEM